MLSNEGKVSYLRKDREPLVGDAGHQQTTSKSPTDHCATPPSNK